MNGLKFSASGKLLLFGEYLVLRGSKSIAIPLKFGQTLSVNRQQVKNILWQAFENGQPWLEITFSAQLDIMRATDMEQARSAQKILQFIHQQLPSRDLTGCSFRFDIDFSRHYGMGTSSTFISLLAQWSDVDPYFILEECFGGSGYDIAAATAMTPIVYQRIEIGTETERKILPFHLTDGISSKLLFVYTGKKQSSRREVSAFHEKIVASGEIEKMNHIVDSVLQCSAIDDFEKLMHESEALLSGILKMPPVQSDKFSDYPYAIKSSGAWGGDFIIATFRKEEAAKDYFKSKGMNPIFNYCELIKV